MDADTASAVPWIHVFQQGVQSFHAAAEVCGTWQKGSGFPSPAAEDTWLLETPVAAAGGNAKQIGVREDKDVSAPVHSFL